jgi:transcriptional regulator with XRE-family HTH domain
MSIKSKMTEKTLKDIENITGGKLTLGKLIWAIRKADDISQVDFAEELNISKQQLSDIEHGKPVSPQLAAKYAEILGHSKEQFIRLAIQDSLERAGLDDVEVEIKIMSKRRRKQHGHSVAASH